MNKEEFVDNIKNLGIDITKNQEQSLDKYLKLLINWNEKFNLTSITMPTDIYLKHFYDSICLVKGINLNKIETLCDIGTGAGFPGIIIKIFYPKINITLIESNNKKCMFLKEVIKELNLENIKVINERTEIYSKNNKEIYDVVTCRAVSHLKVILEMSIPLLKVKGYFVPLKGKIDKELQESEEIIKKLNIKLEKIINYKLPIEGSERNLPVFQKVKKTSDLYPREYNKIIKDLKK